MKLHEVNIEYRDGTKENFQAKQMQLKDWVQATGAEGVRYFASHDPILKMQLIDETDVVICMSVIKKLEVMRYEGKVQGVPCETVPAPNKKQKE
jgi:hypothetical protein